MKNLFKLAAFAIIMIFFMGCGECKKESINGITEADWETLRYLKEVEWSKAYREQDTLLLDRILGDDFQMVDQEGKWYTKADEIEWIKNNAYTAEDFRFEIKRFDILDNGTAIICGAGHFILDSLAYVYQSSNVLEKRNGQWKAVLSHVSGLKEE